MGNNHNVLRPPCLILLIWRWHRTARHQHAQQRNEESPTHQLPMPPERDCDGWCVSAITVYQWCVRRPLLIKHVFSDRPYMALRHGIAINSDIDDANYAVWEYGWVYMNIGIHSCGNQYGDAWRAMHFAHCALEPGRESRQVVSLDIPSFDMNRLIVQATKRDTSRKSCLKLLHDPKSKKTWGISSRLEETRFLKLGNLGNPGIIWDDLYALANMCKKQEPQDTFWKWFQK